VRRVVRICLLAALASCGSPDARVEDTRALAIQLPDGEGGIGFDDLRFSARLGRVLVPAGGTGNLDLVDAESRAVEAIAGFGRAHKYSGGHGDGVTSVDEGRGLLFAIDRTQRAVDAVDPHARRIVASAPLAASPDYVRFAAQTGELWVTEPDAEQIEVFALEGGQPPALRAVATVPVPGGPESLEIDAARGRAYTHLWRGATLAIDVATRATGAHWPNRCTGSRGLALDGAAGWLFAGCAEGRIAVLDVAHGGKVISVADTDPGVDIIAYDTARRHLYVPSAKRGTLSILSVSADGRLARLGTSPGCAGAHGVATDQHGRVFVGDPRGGRLLVLADEFPPASR
jgi:hypothetical protein